MEPLTAQYPPLNGGGEGVSYGYKGKGILIHSITDANGMPVVAVTTPANGDERQQVLPMLAQRKLATGANEVIRRSVALRLLRQTLDTMLNGCVTDSVLRVFDHRAKNGRLVAKNPRADQYAEIVPRYQQERSFSWFQRKYRRLVVRWERLKVCFDAFLLLACFYIWFPRVSGIGSWKSH